MSRAYYEGVNIDILDPMGHGHTHKKAKRLQRVIWRLLPEAGPIPASWHANKV